MGTRPRPVSSCVFASLPHTAPVYTWNSRTTKQAPGPDGMVKIPNACRHVGWHVSCWALPARATSSTTSDSAADLSQRSFPERVCFAVSLGPIHQVLRLGHSGRARRRAGADVVQECISLRPCSGGLRSFTACCENLRLTQCEIQRGPYSTKSMPSSRQRIGKNRRNIRPTAP